MSFDRLKKDIEAIAKKHGVVDYAFVFSSSLDCATDEIYLSTITECKKDSPYEKEFRGIRRALITGKFLNNG